MTVSAFLASLTILALSAAGQTSPGTLTTIFNFPDTNGRADAGVVIGAGGTLYGTTTWPNGTVYSLTPPVPGRIWTYTVLYTFTESVYLNSLAVDSNGVLYGTAFQGGDTAGGCDSTLLGCGFVFSLTPPAAPGGSWTETNLYNFTGGTDGAAPGAGVTLGPGGVLYGTTELRGLSGLGTVFSLTPPTAPGGAWTETTLHTFAGGADGGAPAAILAIDSHGVLYGTTDFGGTSDRGTVFSMTPPASPGGTWSETVLYSFGGDGGGEPNGGVLLGPTGVLYGSTRYGGSTNGGVVYALAPPSEPGGAWTETVLHTFPLEGVQGPYPGPLAWGSDGVLYGITSLGGASHDGSVFALIPPGSGESAWTFLALCSLVPPGGTLPVFGFYFGGETPAVAASGAIYGTAFSGGTSQYYGTVFAVRP